MVWLCSESSRSHVVRVESLAENAFLATLVASSSTPHVLLGKCWLLHLLGKCDLYRLAGWINAGP